MRSKSRTNCTLNSRCGQTTAPYYAHRAPTIVARRARNTANQEPLRFGRFQELHLQFMLNLRKLLLRVVAFFLTLRLNSEHFVHRTDKLLVRVLNCPNIDYTALRFFDGLYSRNFKRIGIFLKKLVRHVRNFALCSCSLIRMLYPDCNNHLVFPKRTRIYNR